MPLPSTDPAGQPEEAVRKCLGASRSLSDLSLLTSAHPAAGVAAHDEHEQADDNEQAEKLGAAALPSTWGALMRAEKRAAERDEDVLVLFESCLSGAHSIMCKPRALALALSLFPRTHKTQTHTSAHTHGTHPRARTHTCMRPIGRRRGKPRRAHAAGGRGPP